MTGMQLFALSGEFRELNVGLALDEGLAREDDAVTVFYGERHKQWTKVRSPPFVLRSEYWYGNELFF